MEERPMTTFIYPAIEWCEETTKLYNADPEWEKKLRKLKGHYCFRIAAEPAIGIDKDLYVGLIVNSGKLEKFAWQSEEFAKKEADYIMGASHAIWKSILIKESKFVTSFLAGKVKLEQGSRVGALGLGAYAHTLVDMMTQVDLKFGDDISPEDLEKHKSQLAENRQKLGA